MALRLGSKIFEGGEVNDFEKKLNKAALEYSLGEQDTCHRVDFTAGARFGFREGVQWAIDKLRSDEAISKDFIDGTFQSVVWSSWLESEFKSMTQDKGEK